MRSHFLLPWRAVVGGSAALVFLLLPGCVGPVKPPDVAAIASQAASVRNAIRFETEGGSIDAPGETPSSLTVEAATMRALANSPEIQAALARVRAAEADARQARLLPNPIVSITVRPRFGPESAIISPAISEDLISILERPRSASAADHRLRAASGEALAEVLNTLAEVQERYADVQAGEAQLAVLGERRKLLDRLLGLARARLKAGEGSRLDVTTVEAQSENLQFEIAQQGIDLNEARLSLARLIGQPGGRTDWQLSPWAPPPHIDSAQRAWLACALRSRPEIQSGIWELSALGDDLALARFAPWEGATIGVESERDLEWSVGPSVSFPLPLFDMGQEKKVKAVAAVIEGRHKLTQTKRQVVEEVRKAYDTFTATQAVLSDARSKLLPLQQAQQRLAEATYQAGESDLTTLLVAQESLEDTNAKLVEFEQKTAVAFVRLQRAAGGPGAAATLVRADSQPSTAPSTAGPPATGSSSIRPTSSTEPDAK
ncbi:MAG TPA: TolC family protein [Tepidisphaeraceae bacterium]|nr:TolC family protein [Tepidisphaeraceae bacterium]